MNTKFLSSIPMRVLVIVALVIPLALGAVFPTKASYPGSSLIGWGSNNDGVIDIPAGLTDITAIAAGPSHNLALERVMNFGLEVVHSRHGTKSISK